MKKIFKALSVFAASAALCAGIAGASACSGGYNGVYKGEYTYTNQYGAKYGMSVEVTVENNIITKIKDTTAKEHADWTVVSKDYIDYYCTKWDKAEAYAQFKTTYLETHPDAKEREIRKNFVLEDYWTANSSKFDAFKTEYLQEHAGATEEEAKVAFKEQGLSSKDYAWSESSVSNWTSNEAYLLQKYEGWAVADIMDIKVYVKETGEPYDKALNTGMSDLLIQGATQSSGRLLLAVQNAFGRTVDHDRIETQA